MRVMIHGFWGPLPLMALVVGCSGLLAGCQDMPQSHPFPAGWRSLAETEIVMTVEADGSATLKGVPQGEPHCDGHPSGWTPGSATWKGIGKGQLEVISSNRPGQSLFVQAKTPFGSVEWGTIYVGLCGRDSSGDQWIELKGGPDITGG